jgi:hypothetical protein
VDSNRLPWSPCGDKTCSIAPHSLTNPTATLRSIWAYFRSEMKQFLKMQVHRNYSSNDSEQCKHYSRKIQDYSSQAAQLCSAGEVKLGTGRCSLDEQAWSRGRMGGCSLDVVPKTNQCAWWGCAGPARWSWRRAAAARTSRPGAEVGPETTAWMSYKKIHGAWRGCAAAASRCYLQSTQLSSDPHRRIGTKWKKAPWCCGR